MFKSLTCRLVESLLDGLHPVADGLDGDGVVAARLQLRDGEALCLHHHARAVPVECLQLCVLDLNKKIF